MKEEAIRKYAGLMKELDLTGLEVKEDGYELRLERGGRPVPASTETYVVADSAPEAKPEVKAEEGTVITSPMVGVFYAAPAEDAEPFVKPGDSVKEGQVLAIIHTDGLL